MVCTQSVNSPHSCTLLHCVTTSSMVRGLALNTKNWYCWSQWCWHFRCYRCSVSFHSAIMNQSEAEFLNSWKSSRTIALYQDKSGRIRCENERECLYRLCKNIPKDTTSPLKCGLESLSRDFTEYSLIGISRISNHVLTTLRTDTQKGYALFSLCSFTVMN